MLGCVETLRHFFEKKAKKEKHRKEKSVKVNRFNFLQFQNIPEENRSMPEGKIKSVRFGSFSSTLPAIAITGTVLPYVFLYRFGIRTIAFKLFNPTIPTGKCS